MSEWISVKELDLFCVGLAGLVLGSALFVAGMWTLLISENFFWPLFIAGVLVGVAAIVAGTFGLVRER